MNILEKFVKINEDLETQLDYRKSFGALVAILAYGINYENVAFDKKALKELAEKYNDLKNDLTGDDENVEFAKDAIDNLYYNLVDYPEEIEIDIQSEKFGNDLIWEAWECQDLPKWFTRNSHQEFQDDLDGTIETLTKRYKELLEEIKEDYADEDDLKRALNPDNPEFIAEFRELIENQSDWINCVDFDHTQVQSALWKLDSD